MESSQKLAVSKAKELEIKTKDVLLYLRDHDFIRGVAVIEGGAVSVPVYWDPMHESWHPTGMPVADGSVLQMDLNRRGYELAPDILLTSAPTLPTAKTIFQDLADGDCQTVCGCPVGPDETCEHGLPASGSYYCQV